MKTKFIVCWVEIANGKRKKKTVYSVSGAFALADEIKQGTLFEKAKSDTVRIIDTESGIEITL